MDQKKIALKTIDGYCTPNSRATGLITPDVLSCEDISMQIDSLSFADDRLPAKHQSDCIPIFSVSVVGNTGISTTVASNSLQKEAPNKDLGTSVTDRSAQSSRAPLERAVPKTASMARRKAQMLCSQKVSPHQIRTSCQSPASQKKFSAHKFDIDADLERIHREIDCGEINLNFKKEEKCEPYESLA